MLEQLIEQSTYLLIFILFCILLIAVFLIWLIWHLLKTAIAKGVEDGIYNATISLYNNNFISNLITEIESEKLMINSGNDMHNETSNKGINKNLPKRQIESENIKV